MQSEKASDQEYMVLVNHEEQYSLWPKGKPVPAGWSAIGTEGSKEECMKFVDGVWTDMRPLSLRKQMDTPQPNVSADRDR